MAFGVAVVVVFDVGGVGGAGEDDFDGVDHDGVRADLLCFGDDLLDDLLGGDIDACFGGVGADEDVAVGDGLVGVVDGDGFGGWEALAEVVVGGGAGGEKRDRGRADEGGDSIHTRDSSAGASQNTK